MCAVMQQPACLLASMYGHDFSAYCCVLEAAGGGHETCSFLSKVIGVFLFCSVVYFHQTFRKFVF